MLLFLDGARKKEKVPPITQRPESLHLKQTLKLIPNIGTLGPKILDTLTPKQPNTHS